MLLASIFELLGEEFPQLREGSSPYFHLKGSLRMVLTTPYPSLPRDPKTLFESPMAAPSRVADTQPVNQPTNGPMGELFASSSLGS